MRNAPLKGFLKKSPMRQEGPKMPKDHPVTPPKKAKDYKTEKYDGPKVIGGSVSSPASDAIGIAKGVKKVYKHLTS